MMNNEKLLEKLIEAFLDRRNKKEMRDFLNGILTPKELDEIAVRLEIVKKLKSGYRQQSIAQELGTGVATVTRGSRELRKGRFRYI